VVVVVVMAVVMAMMARRGLGRGHQRQGTDGHAGQNDQDFFHKCSSLMFSTRGCPAVAVWLDGSCADRLHRISPWRSLISEAAVRALTEKL